MIAISLWQPWASLWCSPRKIHETRHWSTHQRGWIAVHAAKKLVRDVSKELIEILEDEFGPHWGVQLPKGALIGAVSLTACERTEDVYSEYSFPDATQQDTDDYLCGDFAEGRFAWRRGEFKLLPAPIPYVGRQGFFAIDYETSKLLDTLVAAAA